MSGDWRVDVLIAIIGALGLIIPGWLTFKGAVLGKNREPNVEQHGTLAWEHSKTRDFIAREHDETRRQLRETERSILGSLEDTRKCVTDTNNRIPWEVLATLSKLKTGS